MVHPTTSCKNKIGDPQPSVYIDGNEITRVKSQKFLGVEIDENLKFDKHIEKICKKASAGIGAIRRIKPFVPPSSLENVYKCLVQPYFDYCAPVWDTRGKTLTDKLQKLQSRTARVITGAKYEERSVDVLQGLGWEFLEKRRLKLKLIMMLKILHDQSVPLLRNLFLKVEDFQDNYDLRNRDTDLALPKPKTNYLKRSLRYSGAMLWNSLEKETKKAQTLASFKRLLR